MPVNRWEAENRRSRPSVAAEQGEEVLIARNGLPVARIVPYGSPAVNPPGAGKGLVPDSTDWGSAATERAIERGFHGEDEAPAAGYRHPPRLVDGRHGADDCGLLQIARCESAGGSESSCGKTSTALFDIPF